MNLADAAEDGVRFKHIFKRDGVENFIMSRQTFNRREFACFLFHGNPFDFMLIKEEKLC